MYVYTSKPMKIYIKKIFYKLTSMTHQEIMNILHYSSQIYNIAFNFHNIYFIIYKLVQDIWLP